MYYFCSFFIFHICYRLFDELKSIYNNTDVDLFYNQISTYITCMLHNLIPMTVVFKRKPTCNKFVLSPEALAAKRSWGLLERRYATDRSESNRLLYGAACVTASNHIKALREDTNASCLAAASTSPRDLWKVSKKILNMKIRHSSSTSGKLDANYFSQYFLNKLVSISSNISKSIAALGLPSVWATPTFSTTTRSATSPTFF